MSDQSGITRRLRTTWPSETDRLRVARHLSIVLAIAVSGCVPQSSELQLRSEPAKFAAPSSQPEPHLCRPATALLAPARAPDCVFRRAASKAMDPDEFSRLKVEFELSCYQNAERAVRRRLRELQAANRCLIASAR
jgi:hypothetical protein